MCGSTVRGWGEGFFDFGHIQVFAIVNAGVGGEEVDAAVVGVRGLEEGELRGERGNVGGEEGWWHRG